MQKKSFVLYVILLASIFIFNRCSENITDGDNENVSLEAYKVATLKISTENEIPVTSKEVWLNCTISLESGNTNWNFSGVGQVRGRGNSSWLWYPKKPYKLKLNEKTAILGLDSAKKWVLLADYRDPTHLMNTFVFTVEQELGFAYPNHSRYVEITLNGDYIGMYILTEQVEQGKSRVNIDADNGILISLDADDGPGLSPDVVDNFWSSVYYMPVCVKNPEITSDNQSTLTSVKYEFAELERTIKNADYDALNSLMDIPSFIDFLLIQELVYNVELAAPRSMYMYKDVNGKWEMGPLWDFDAGFDFDWGTMYTGHTYFTSYKELVMGTVPVTQKGGYDVPNFFTDMFQSKRFVSEYKARWLEIKDKIMSDYWTTTMIYADNFTEAEKRDVERWPIDKDNQTEILKMEEWLTNRINYLNTVIANYPDGTK